MATELVVNAHRQFAPGKPVLFCIPDIRDSVGFVNRGYELGLNLILLLKPKWQKTTNLDGCLAYIIVDDVKQENVADAVTAVQKLQQTLPGAEAIDYYLAFSELNMDFLGALVEGLTGICVHQPGARAFRDKRVMRELAQVKGLPCPVFAPADQLLSARSRFTSFVGDVGRAAERKRAPVGFVLKPRDSWGARGVEVYAESEALWAALCALQEPQQYLVEERIVGTLVHVDSAVLHRQVIYHGMGIYLYSFIRSEVEGPHFMWHSVAPDGALGRALTLFNQKVVQAFGLDYGFTHTEVFVESGTGDLVLCETASRPPGLQLLDLHAMSQGSHAYDHFLDGLVGQTTASAKRFHTPRTVGLVIFNPMPGVLTEVRPLEEILDEHVIAWEQNAQVGTNYEESHYTAELGRIVCAAPTEEECRPLLENYISRFHCSFADAAPQP